jgi:polyisoprenoid-binding protein YceI
MKLLKKSYFFTMNNKLSLLYLILIIAPVFSSCRGPKARENETHVLANSATLSRVTNEKYAIDKKESVITYKGSMLLASKGSHTGYVYLSNGELIIDSGQLVGGTVEIDMNTIADIDHGSENDLVRHLKSPDFFDVEKFPVSVFAITMVVPVTRETINVTGNLSIKGITHAVTFPVTIEVKDGIVHANGKVTIDRTRWDVRYNSGKFFSNLADEVISDEIEFDMKIVAKR